VIPEDAFPLHTGRLFLRPVTLSDAGALYELYADWEVARWLSRLPWPFTRAAAQSLVVDAIDQFTRGSGCFLAMVEHETSAFVGVVSLRIPAMEPQAWTTDREHGVAERFEEAMQEGFTATARQRGQSRLQRKGRCHQLGSVLAAARQGGAEDPGDSHERLGTPDGREAALVAESRRCLCRPGGLDPHPPVGAGC